MYQLKERVTCSSLFRADALQIRGISLCNIYVICVYKVGTYMLFTIYIYNCKRDYNDTYIYRYIRNIHTHVSTYHATCAMGGVAVQELLWILQQQPVYLARLSAALRKTNGQAEWLFFAEIHNTSIISYRYIFSIYIYVAMYGLAPI